MCVFRYIQILHISQEIAGNDKSALDTLLDCDVERKALLREKELIEGPEDVDGKDEASPSQIAQK